MAREPASGKLPVRSEGAGVGDNSPPPTDGQRKGAHGPGSVQRGVTLELFLHGAAIALAVLLRLVMLDARPLAEGEAAMALESYRLWHDEAPAAVQGNPLALMGAALAIALFGAGDGQVRVLSVVAGSALVAAPYLLRSSIGRQPAVLAAFGLALSPLMVFASRSVGSGVVALLLAALLWWMVREGSRSASGWWVYASAVMAAGLIASGRDGITLLASLLLAALLSSPLPSKAVREAWDATAPGGWRWGAAVLVASAAMIGTGFGAFPPGLQWVLVDVWTGWLDSFSLTAPRAGLLLLLVLYELPVVILGVTQLVRSVVMRDRTDSFLAIWAMATLLLVMVQDAPYSSRLLLPLFPLYLLAARLAAPLLAGMTRGERGWRWNLAAVGVGTPLAVGVGLLNRASTPNTAVPEPFLYAELALVGVALLSLWSLPRGHARVALVGSFLAVLASGYLVHSLFFTNYVMPGQRAEAVVAAQPSAALRAAASEAAYYSRYLGVALTVDPGLRPSVEWYLRDAPAVNWSPQPAQGIMIATSQPGAGEATREWERRPGAYIPELQASRLSWQELWRWGLNRAGLVVQNQRDIIVRAPAGNW